MALEVEMLKSSDSDAFSLGDVSIVWSDRRGFSLSLVASSASLVKKDWFTSLSSLFILQNHLRHLAVGAGKDLRCFGKEVRSIWQRNWKFMTCKSDRALEMNVKVLARTRLVVTWRGDKQHLGSFFLLPSL